MAHYLEGYTIKLKIVNKDDEVRRIPSHKLFKNHNRAYKRLVSLAVEYFQGDDFDINASPEDFSVKISYVDMEGDKITISSQDEFIDATKELLSCKQSKRLDSPRKQRSQFVLHFEASVLKKTGDFMNDAPDDFKESLREMKERLVKCEKDNEIRRMWKAKHCGPFHMDKVRGHRLMRMKKHAAHLKSQLDAEPECIKKFCDGNNDFTVLIIHLVESLIALLNRSVFELKAHTSKNTEMKDTSMCTEETKPSESETDSVEAPATVNVTEPVMARKPPEIVKRCHDKSYLQKRQKMMAVKRGKACPSMILHKGIKCDGCGMIPIAGTRYHAKPDYDLCTGCHTKNKSDMKFEVIETPQIKCIFKPKPTVKPVSVSFPYPTKNKKCTDNLDSTFIHARHTCDGCMTTPIIGLRYNAINLKDYDLCSTCYTKCKDDDIVFECIELASDRSRQNFWKNKFDIMSSMKATQTKMKKQETSTVTDKTQKESKVEPVKTTEQELNDADKIQIAAALAESFVTQAVKSVKESLKEPKEPKEVDDQTVSTEESTKDLEEEMTNTEGNSTTLLKNEIEKDIANVTKLMVELTEMEDKSDKKTKVDEISYVDATTSIDDSVSSETEDKAKMDEEKIETNDISKSDDVSECSSNTSVVNLSLKDEKIDEKPKDVSARVKINDTACPDDKLNNVEDEVKSIADEEKSSGTADEWDLVDEEKDQIENDEMLARAAQMVGSLLFEEDQGRPNEVITSIESDISAMLLNKWGNELFKLRELGFIDDKKSLDVLERLEAANIGVDSDEPIKIEKIVDELLERTAL